MNTIVENINDLKDTIQINLTALKEFQKQGAQNLDSAFSMLNYYLNYLTKKEETKAAEKKTAKEILFGGANNGR